LLLDGRSQLQTYSGYLANLKSSIKAAASKAKTAKILGDE